MPGRIAQLIRHFVDRSPGCGRTRIVKLLYMVDHEARRYLGRPLTDLDYRWDNYGPFDPEIRHQLDRMSRDGYLEATEDQGNGYTSYRYRPASRELPCPLAKDERAIVDLVLDQYADMRLDTLLEDVVYQTRPMAVAVSRGERLRMGLVDNEARIPGLELGDVLESAEELRAGGGLPFEGLLVGAKDEAWAKAIEPRFRSIREAAERP